MQARIFEFAQTYLREHPNATEQELREVLHCHFLGDVDYLDAATQSGSLTHGPEGCLFALLLAPLFFLWHLIFPKDRYRIAQDIEAAVKSLKGWKTEPQ